MIGLPGTGLGGIFYVLLVAWMAIREAWLSLRAASHSSRWKKIASLTSLAAAILAALWVEGWILSQFLTANPSIGQSVQAALRKQMAMVSLMPVLSAAPFVVLAALFVAVHILKQFFRWRSKVAESTVVSNANLSASHTS